MIIQSHHVSKLAKLKAILFENLAIKYNIN